MPTNNFELFDKIYNEHMLLADATAIGLGTDRDTVLSEQEAIFQDHEEQLRNQEENER